MLRFSLKALRIKKYHLGFSLLKIYILYNTVIFEDYISKHTIRNTEMRKISYILHIVMNNNEYTMIDMLTLCYHHCCCYYYDYYNRYYYYYKHYYGNK